MVLQLRSIHKIASTYQECHNVEIEYLERAMINMTVNIMQLKTGIEGAISMGIPSIWKERADHID